MTERALTFGAAAAAYELHRPDYPPEIVDRVLVHADGDVRTALEIGAGTGKATRVFAARGIAVTATDPDAQMLAELRRHVPESVTARQSTLEAYPEGEVFDLVYAAASLHWTDPATRFTRIARLLRPGGVFACFGGPTRLSDPEVRAAVREARSPVLSDDRAPRQEVTPGQGGLEWPGTELAASPMFTDVVAAVVPRRSEVAVDDYLGYLSTVSAYLMLSRQDRDDVFARIRAALPELVAVSSDLRIHLARRV
ncbi:class I SAM-dependent methyltransferase [Nocardioides sp. Root151]|uniref:class I SAM-dependent methyltransferase n=1 Tax=Nocardioides sp. Root151 TaxID=1736475 RepID=UPI0007034E3E|nr:class I SAM-dependent methyltransferase [Nocardioides sp. Root151]KQZ70334.1 methyltransferase [Nocardioides sp. Root151]